MAGKNLSDKQRELQNRLTMARAEAIKPPEQPAGPEWPNTDGLDLEAQCMELTVQMYTQGAKIALGITSEATSVWARISYPKWAADRTLAGKSALTFSSDVAGALLKLSLLSDDPTASGFKDDPYAK